MAGRSQVIKRLVVTTFLTMNASGAVFASFEQSANDIFDRQKAIDSDNRTTDTNTRTLMAGCDITQALISALNGDKANFGSALENASGNLAKSADGLRSLASKKLFEKQVNISGLKLSSVPANGSGGLTGVVVTPDRTITGDALLLAIANLAERSAAIISRMRDGKPTNDDLTTLIQNNGDIAQLILAFYGLLTQRVKG